MSRTKPSDVTCSHTKLSYDLSTHAYEVGFSRPTPQHRLMATTPQGTLKSIEHRQEESPATFPAPLLLPGDDLAWDPKHPPQSLRSWIREKDRNKVNPKQRTVYLAAAPSTDKEVNFISKWIHPKKTSTSGTAKVPKIEDVLAYLQAFYHGLPVKLLDSSIFRFVPVESEEYSLGLETNSSSGCIGIKTRPTPKEYSDFTHQLNLNDLLDAAIAVLPEDAYALLMLVDHDIYEDDDDDFACGRAYGGSRIAVVSTARYNPALDRKAGIERGHAWPASHCEKYMQSCCEHTEPQVAQKKKGTTASEHLPSSLFTSPIGAAVAAHTALPDLESTPSVPALAGLWLGRVCRTAGHELGHCFGMDHCTYYACSMQGTASVIEDARQPPYLCPVDLSKMLKATGTGPDVRYRALLEFCDERKDIHLFAAFGAWIRGRLRGMETEIIVIDSD